MGAANGAVSTATGVFMFPVIPYIQSLGLERDDLVQAQGISFTVSTFALTLVVLGNGTLNATNATASFVAMAITFVGMFVGQYIRKFVQPEIFRLLFFMRHAGARRASRLHSSLSFGTAFTIAGSSRNCGSIGTGNAGMVAPLGPATLCANSPRSTKCGSRSASSSVAMMVTQQSAAANTGRHSSAVRAGDDRGDRGLGRRRIAAVVDQLRRQARSRR